MSCYICSEPATVEVKYIESIGMKRREKRCDICAESIRNTDQFEIINEENLRDEENIRDEEEEQSQQNRDKTRFRRGPVP